jgi:hypothetical protein
MSQEHKQIISFIGAALVAIVVAYFSFQDSPTDPDFSPTPRRPADVKPGTYTFAFYNVENLFDDVKDDRTAPGDKDYDPWLAENPDVLKQKLINLRTVIFSMDGSAGEKKGPDILAVAEVESLRALQLLQKELNAHLEDDAKYTDAVWEYPEGNRHIGTGVISRLPIIKRDTQILGRRQRILETRIAVGKSELVVVSSHWSSRISDKTGDSRKNYADVIYGRFRAMYTANPKVDFLVCGDFNDDPTDESVKDNLHAIGDVAKVRAGGKEPFLFNAFAKFPTAEKGTHYYRKWHQFDMICLSPGMFDDQGWSFEKDSEKIIERLADSRNWRPDRFGGKSDKRPLDKRGAADHFPVVVTLKVR